MIGMVDEMTPEVMFSSEQLPEIADWKVGEEYTLAVKVKQTSVHEGGKEDKLCAHFKVLSVAPVEKYNAGKTKVDKTKVAQALVSKMSDEDEGEYEEE